MLRKQIGCGIALLASNYIGAVTAQQPAQLEEIVVTAQKRAEPLQKVPIAITAVDSSRLESLGLTSNVDMQFAIPGLEVTSIVGNFQPYIRGIGNDITQGVDNSVALHIDGVYIPTLTVQIQDLIGVDRIEVLKGPQGTLYGRNATGGVINIITKDPDTNTTQVTATAGLGNFADHEYQLYANVPVGTEIAGNLAVSYREHNPYNRNLDVGGPYLRKAEDVVLRGKLLYRPTDAIRLLFTAMGTSRIDDDADVAQQIQTNSVGVFFGGRQTTVPFDAYFNDKPRFDSRLQLYALNAKFDLSPFDIVSITGYQSSKAHSAIDFDGTDAPIFYFDVHNISDTFTQELQVLSKPGGRLNWIGGLYYLNGEFQFRPVGLVAAPAPNYIYSKDTTRSYAGFGQLSFELIDKLTLTAGIRYTHEKKALPLDSLTDAAGNVLLPAGGPSKTWSKTTPKFSLEYALASTVSLWASAGRGFKSGGFDAAAPTNVGPVNPEVLDAVEAGVKSEFADRRVRLNLSLYHYHVKDLQVQVVTNSSQGGAFTQNAATANIQGGELELSAQATDHLRLDAGVAVIDGHYSSFPDYAGFLSNAPFPGNSNAPRDVGGFSTTRSPKHTYNVNAQYVQPMPIGDLVANALYFYSDSYAFDPARQGIQHAYGIVNASVGYVSPDSKFKLTLWGHNLGDKTYLAINNVNALGTFVTYAPPRTYGATVSYDIR